MPFHRRVFLCFSWLALFLTTPAVSADVQNLKTDLLIVGGTESGWAAAIQAARLGVPSVTIVHDGEWLGGQFTEQALACVDENKGVGNVGWGVDWHPMKRSFHRSGLFKELMDRIEAFNTETYGSPMPGRPYHGPSTFRPAEAEAIFREMLQPHLDSGQVQFVANRYPVQADVVEEGDRSALKGLWFASLEGKQVDLHVEAKLTIDASDWGEAIQVSGAAFECGPDPRSRYAEPSAPEDLSENPPNEMNPITWAMIVAESDADTPIAEPPFHDDRRFVRVSHISREAMRDLRWDRPAGAGSILHWPDAGQASPRQLSVYTVRRIVDGYTSKDGKTSILLNYMNGQDYPLERLPQHVVDALEATEPGSSQKNIVLMTREQRQIVFDDAKRQSLSVLYHLQNFVHDRAPDKTNSFRRFHLSDEFGTPDQLPLKPYIRESLRLKAMYMMREQDGRNTDGTSKQMARERFAQVMYPDGLFAWQFHYDFHRTGRAYLRDEGESGPWIDYEKPGRHTHHVSDRSLFPLRSLIPEEMDGLLGAQKNVGYSSIVCAAIRLHDQCIAIGQAAGATAAISLKNNTAPRTIPYDRTRLEQVRDALCHESPDCVPLLIWPFRDLSADHEAFVAVNRLAARGALPLEARDVDFRPDDVASMQWSTQVLNLVSKSKVTRHLSLTSNSEATRGEFCRELWEQIEELPDVPFVRLSPEDADGDGVLDINDPSLFTKGEPILWRVAPPSPEQDGLPRDFSPDKGAIRYFNFTGKGSSPVEGFESDYGLPFDTTTGRGWDRDLSANNRRRNVYPETYRDTFLFTRDEARWECAVSNGRWRVAICCGDAGHEQTGHRVTCEGQIVVDGEPTSAGQFIERTVEIDIQDGRLTLELGPQQSGSNTCVNWVGIQKL
ncbi:MAG: FAD-dependent oxidoreductase [Planctomycetaceae bacterium]|nr:FAD-dependent oxidoreductase [Planctomycetaceae bacterium]